MSGENQADGTGTGETEGAQPGSETTGGTESDATFTQADVDRMMAERAAREKRSTLAAVTEALGGKKPEEAAKLLQELEESRRANMDEAERLTLEAREANARAAERETEAAVVAQEALVRTALLTPIGDDGTMVNPAMIADAAVLVQTEMAGNDGMTPAEAVAAVAKRVPALFAESSGSQTTRTPAAPGRPAGERRGAGEQGNESKAKGLLEEFLARDRGRQPRQTS